MRFVYIHILWFGCWIGFGVEDYPYGLLTMIVSLEAIFLSTFVMISQNRADAKRQVIADQQWQTVKEEDRQNEELLELSHQILELTKAIHAVTTPRPAEVAPALARGAADPVRGRAGNRRGDLPPVLDRDVRFGAAVYGSFLAASVVGVAYESGAGARTMTAALVGSMLVFWAAHVWSEVVGERIELGEAFRPRDALLIARREWPLVEAAALPSILLALAWAGAWSRETGAKLALAAALVQVVAWGFAAGRRAGGSPLAATVLAAGEGMLAVLLLGAERFVP